LSTRITNIQREINPYIHFTGGTAKGTATSVYIDRKAQGEFLMAANTLSIKATDLSGIIPDGGKILSMKVSNVNGRKMQVQIPGVNGLVNNDGATGSSNSDVTRVVYAPLNRFPVLKIQIPDLVAVNQDTNGTSSEVLFILTTDGPTDRVVVHFHYKQAI